MCAYFAIKIVDNKVAQQNLNVTKSITRLLINDQRVRKILISTNQIHCYFINNTNLFSFFVSAQVEMNQVI